jgi:hypothetical protein
VIEGLAPRAFRELPIDADLAAKNRLMPPTLRQPTVMPRAIPKCRTVFKPTISLVVETIIGTSLKICPR